MLTMIYCLSATNSVVAVYTSRQYLHKTATDATLRLLLMMIWSVESCTMVIGQQGAHCGPVCLSCINISVSSCSSSSSNLETWRHHSGRCTFTVAQTADVSADVSRCCISS